MLLNHARDRLKHTTLAGGIIQVAAPHFYNAPQTVADVMDTVVERTLQLPQGAKDIL